MSLARRLGFGLQTVLRARRPAVVALLPVPAALERLSVRLASSKRKQASPAAAATSADDAGEDDSGVDPAKIKEAMSKHVAYAQREFGKIRGSTANPAMIDHVMVDAYGEAQALKGLAQITPKSSTLLLVTPFDASLCAAISDAIRGAGLSLNPGVDGNGVKVPIPRPSAESREAAIKVIGKVAEAAKNRIRRTRQHAIDNLKKAAGASPDDLFRSTKEIQDVTNAVNEELVKLAEAKKAEISAAGGGGSSGSD